MPIICPGSVISGGLSGNTVAELCPTPQRVAALFTELILNGNLVIPPQKPPKKHIVKVTHQITVQDVEVITVNIPPVPPATVGTTGYKILVAGNVRLVIQYVADVPDQKVHSVHYDIPFEAIVVGDCGDLLDAPPANFVVHVCVEKIRVAQIDPRTLSKQIVLMVWVEEQ